jgi:uncharacterized membrane protein YciS (DUF1049 family)
LLIKKLIVCAICFLLVAIEIYFCQQIFDFFTNNGEKWLSAIFLIVFMTAISLCLIIFPIYYDQRLYLESLREQIRSEKNTRNFRGSV